MGFMDKAKEAAEKAKVSAQQMGSQGQAKVEAFQFDRATAELNKTLGEAYHAEQRRGGAHDAVTTALDALDRHLAAKPEPPAPPAGDLKPGG